jgi:hypothetical protein
MKIKSVRIMALLIVFLAGVSADSFAQQSTKKTKSPKKIKTEQIKLFNGKDFSNWVFKMKNPAIDPTKVFTVQNGVIAMTGEFGYMRTKEEYSDYTLHLEWRWPVEATNSGVFIHAQLPDTIWSKAIECQLKAGNAGDFNCNGGSNMNERKEVAIRVVKRTGPSLEKPIGEWNTMEVACKANTIELFINGVSQNKGTGVFASKGFIGLQSEGKEIQFRNVYITVPRK